VGGCAHPFNSGREWGKGNVDIRQGRHRGKEIVEHVAFIRVYPKDSAIKQKSEGPIVSIDGCQY